MTDNEIIKALELCATLDSSNCKKCPCREICNENDGTLTKLTLELIKRQKAEIERLNTDVKTLENVIKNSFLKKSGLDIDIFAEIKSEAIKEFAEKVDEILCLEIGPSKRVFWKISEGIKNLVKEMEGVSK